MAESGSGDSMEESDLTDTTKAGRSMTDDKKKMSSDLMDIDEICEYTGLSKSTLYRQIRTGKLPARLTGRGYTSLREYVEQFRREYYGRKTT